jgi:hypothetical protein
MRVVGPTYELPQELLVFGLETRILTLQPSDPLESCLQLRDLNFRTFGTSLRERFLAHGKRLFDALVLV